MTNAIIKTYNTMKKKIILLGLILIPCTAIGQGLNVGFSPYSTIIWGQTDATMKASVEYYDVELIAMHAMKPLYHIVENKYMGTYAGYFVGFFYTPTIFEYNDVIIEGGGGIWNRRFPTDQGQRVHFTLQASYQVHRHVSFSYQHYSNGFGIVNKLNPGIDFISMQIHL